MLAEEYGGDEVVGRFGYFTAAMEEMKDLNYAFYFGDHGEPAGPPSVDAEIVAEHARSKRRYFRAFYDSFARAMGSCFNEQRAAVVAAESSCRGSLLWYELSERTALYRGFARVLGGEHPSILLATALHPVMEEAVHRRLLEGEYFSMLLEACEMREILHRRRYVLCEEADERGAIAAREVPCWIEARRRQVTREKDAEEAEVEDLREHEVALFRWRQKQLYQMFLLEQAESDERQVVERQERLEAGAIAGLYSNAYRTVRYAQLRYEDMRRSLDAECARDLSTMEVTARSEVLRQQHDCFRTLTALETRNYLAASKRQIENEAAELM